MNRIYEVSFEGEEPRVSVEAKNIKEAIAKVEKAMPKAVIRSIFPSTIGNIIR